MHKYKSNFSSSESFRIYVIRMYPHNYSNFEIIFLYHILTFVDAFPG